jgi:RHH-type proline utilization regulon transcriptional repressor/proline dehydrogenase/delta 1-pyrroline-5-carboxylate dehydrogenase
MPSPAERPTLKTAGLDDIRAEMRAHILADETETVGRLAASTGLSEDERSAISTKAVRLVERVRKSADPQLMEVFLSEYGRIRANPPRSSSTPLPGR